MERLHHWACVEQVKKGAIECVLKYFCAIKVNIINLFHTSLMMRFHHWDSVEQVRKGTLDECMLKHYCWAIKQSILNLFHISLMMRLLHWIGVVQVRKGMLECVLKHYRAIK